MFMWEDETQAVTTICTLYQRWVSTTRTGVPLSTQVQEIRESLASEREANRQFPARTTYRNKAETHTDAIALGKACKTLGL